jgi:hypothetical protein
MKRSGMHQNYGGGAFRYTSCTLLREISRIKSDCYSDRRATEVEFLKARNPTFRFRELLLLGRAQRLEIPKVVLTKST